MTTRRNAFDDGAQYCIRVRAFQSDLTYGAWTERKPAFTYDRPTRARRLACGATIGTPSGAYRSPVGTASPRTPVFRWDPIPGARVLGRGREGPGLHDDRRGRLDRGVSVRGHRR